MKNIAKIFILALLVSPFLFTGCDDPDLPYPLDEVEHGVLIDISMMPGKDINIDANRFPEDLPDLGVVLNVVPKGDGDWDKLDLVIIYDNFAEGTMEKMVYEEGITSLPFQTELDYQRILDYYGVDQELPGDAFNIVVDITLPSGLVVYGYTDHAGFNNSDFASWRYDDRPYSRRVRYPTVCGINEPQWVGNAYVSRINATGTWAFETEEAIIDIIDPADFPDDLPDGDFSGFALRKFFLDDEEDDLWDGVNESRMEFFIENTTFEVIIPEQGIGITWDIGTALGQAPDFHEIIMEEFGNIELNSCMGILSFNADMVIGDSGYWFNVHTFTVIPLAFFDDNGNDDDDDDDDDDNDDKSSITHFSIK